MPALASSRSNSRQRGAVGLQHGARERGYADEDQEREEGRLREALHLPVEQPRLVEPGVEHAGGDGGRQREGDRRRNRRCRALVERRRGAAEAARQARKTRAHKMRRPA